jgi:hypothetical protein
MKHPVASRSRFALRWSFRESRFRIRQTVWSQIPCLCEFDCDGCDREICCVDCVLPAISRVYSDRFRPRVTVLLRTRPARSEYFPTSEKRVDLPDRPVCRRWLLQNRENSDVVVGPEWFEKVQFFHPCFNHDGLRRRTGTERVV